MIGISLRINVSGDSPCFWVVYSDEWDLSAVADRVCGFMDGGLN